MDTLILYLVLFGLFFAVGVPIVLALSVSAMVMLVLNGMDLLIFAQKFMVSMDNFSLTAMFFFHLGRGDHEWRRNNEAHRRRGFQGRQGCSRRVGHHRPRLMRPFCGD